MEIDPVVLLAEEIRHLEDAITAECKLNSGNYDRRRAEGINMMVERMRDRYNQLLETPPTSALGAGELIRITARRMPFAHARYTAHLHRVADRLSECKRLQTDLIWVRALADTLSQTAADDGARKTALLLTLAVKGMAQPILIYRAVMPQRAPIRRLGDLSAGPRYEMPLSPPPMAYVPEAFQVD